MTCFAAQNKNMIVKFLIDREFIVFFIQNEAESHVAQKVLVDDFIRTAAKSQSEDQRPLLPRAGSPESAAAQS